MHTTVEMGVFGAEGVCETAQEICEELNGIAVGSTGRRILYMVSRRGIGGRRGRIRWEVIKVGGSVGPSILHRRREWEGEDEGEGEEDLTWRRRREER